MIGGDRFFPGFDFISHSCIIFLTLVSYCMYIVLPMTFFTGKAGFSQQFCLVTRVTGFYVISRCLLSEWRDCYQGLLMLMRWGWSPCAFILTRQY